MFDCRPYPFPPSHGFPVDPTRTKERAAFYFSLSFLQEVSSSLDHLYELSTTPRADEASIPVLTKTVRCNFPYDEAFLRRPAGAPSAATGRGASKTPKVACRPCNIPIEHSFMRAHVGQQQLLRSPVTVSQSSASHGGLLSLVSCFNLTCILVVSSRRICDEFSCRMIPPQITY